MKLITKDIEKRFEKYPLYSQDDVEQKKVIAYFFGGCAFTYIAVEAERLDNDDWRFYGACDLGHGFEWGYFMLSDINRRYPPFGLPLERDKYYSSGRYTISRDFKLSYTA